MRQRLYVAGVLAGLGALIVVAVVVLRFGRLDPSPPSLRAHPNATIPGEIAYMDKDNCIIRAAASGARTEQIYCIPLEKYAPQPAVTWVDRNTIAYFSRDEPRMELNEIDLTTKVVRKRVIQTPPLGEYGLFGNRAPSGEVVQQDNEHGLFVVSGGQRTKIAEFDVPEYREPEAETWSPDSQWILLRYYPEDSHEVAELWIFSRDGKTRGTLTTTAGDSETSWWIDGIGVWPNVLQPNR